MIDVENGAAGPSGEWQDHFHRCVANRVVEMNQPVYLQAVLDRIGGEFGPEVAAELRHDLATLPAHALARALGSDQEMRRLSRFARGAQAELGSRSSRSFEVDELAEKYWEDYKDLPGFTKELAKEMARERA